MVKGVIMKKKVFIISLIVLIASCLFAFIQIPLIMAFYEAINRTPAIFEDTEPFTGIANANPFKFPVAKAQNEFVLFIFIITLIISSIVYYLLLPPVNLSSPLFWIFLGSIIII